MSLSMGKELPSELDGYIDKVLSFDQYSGDNSRTAILARKISDLRQEFGFPGDMESDWKEAQGILRNEIVEELLRKQSPSLRETISSDIIPNHNMEVVNEFTSHD